MSSVQQRGSKEKEKTEQKSLIDKVPGRNHVAEVLTVVEGCRPVRLPRSGIAVKTEKQ